MCDFIAVAPVIFELFGDARPIIESFNDALALPSHLFPHIHPSSLISSLMLSVPPRRRQLIGEEPLRQSPIGEQAP
jgi:hypothetical protein